MSQKLLDTLISLDGVHSVMFLSANGACITAGDNKWDAILKESIKLARIGTNLSDPTEEKEIDGIRVYFKDRKSSVSVRKKEGHALAIVMETGHPIVKSVPRLVRRRLDSLAKAANDLPDEVA